MSLCVWQMLLSMLFGSRSLILVADLGSLLQIHCISLPSHCAVHMGCSQIGAIKNSVAMSMPFGVLGSIAFDLVARTKAYAMWV